MRVLQRVIGTLVATMEGVALCRVMMIELQELRTQMMQGQWAALEQRYREGKTRALGVSNFCAACLDCILSNSTVSPQA